MKSATAIKDHFITLLNKSLPRLDMYGGEVFADHILAELSFIDEREEELDAHFKELDTRGARNSCGVTGAFRKCTGLGYHNAGIASVFAEVAYQLGYLKTERVLNEGEFRELSKGLRSACRERDWTTEQVYQKFGKPTWPLNSDIAKRNPFYPCSVLYLCENPRIGSVAFDFWNSIDDKKKTEINTTIGRYGQIPILRNVRIRGSKFARDFTFTPMGKKIIRGE